MSLELKLIGAAATVVLLAAAASARRSLRNTSLINAWGWSLAACCVWLAAAAVELARPESPSVQQAWYFASVVGLCPGIAVLGSRRPTVRVWNAFVILPLIAVLCWPLVLCWMPRGPVRPPMEGPALAGFLFVGVMSFGNYIGTRHTLLTIALGVTNASAFFGAVHPDSSSNRLVGGLVLAAALAMLTSFRRRRASVTRGDWNAVWKDFRNLFGLVWAYRIAERVNHQAARDQWPIRLGQHGFFAVENGMPAGAPADEPHVSHTMRWLLRRFVDEPWIAERLQQTNGEPGTGALSENSTPSAG